MYYLFFKNILTITLRSFWHNTYQKTPLKFIISQSQKETKKDTYLLLKQVKGVECQQ